MKSQLIPYTNIITYQQGYSDQLLLPGLHTYLLEIPHFPEKKKCIQCHTFNNNLYLKLVFQYTDINKTLPTITTVTLVMVLIRLTRKYRNDKLVAAVDWTLESFFSKPLRVSIAWKGKAGVDLVLINDMNTSFKHVMSQTECVCVHSCPYSYVLCYGLAGTKNCFVRSQSDVKFYLYSIMH